MIRLHKVTLGTGSAVVDISCLVDSVTIHYGRDDTNSQPEANSCTLDISLNTAEDTYPADLDVGALVTVTTGASVRFIGRITDITQGWKEAGEDTPDHAEMQVIATGPLAELGRRVVGDAPWGQELDGARVARIMAAAGVTLDPLTSDPGTVQILPRDVDSQPALDVAQSVAESAGGLVWSTQAGEIRYADANHRRGTDAALALDACDILVTPRWSRTTDGLINDVSIGYGVAAEGGDQPRYTAERADSKAAYGEYGLSTTTELAALADATAMGQLLLTRNRVPVWVMSTLPVDVAGLDDARTDALLGLQLHSLVTLTGLPAAGNAPTSAALWVEGWTETLYWDGHEIELVVSGYCRTVPPPRWNDVPPADTWNTTGDTLDNWVTNPAFRAGTTNWFPYSATNQAYTTLSNESTAGDYALKMTKNTASGNLGATSVIGTPRPEGTVITMQCEARFPVGTPLSRQVNFIFRDAPNNDSGCLTVTGGAIGTVIPADGNFHTVYCTGTVKAGRNLTTVYVNTGQAGGGNVSAGAYWHARHISVTDGPLDAYFDGSTPNTIDTRYSWAGTAELSASTRQRGPTWDDATCTGGPSPDFGRWDDVPASSRWDTNPPAVTWDNYTTRGVNNARQYL